MAAERLQYEMAAEIWSALNPITSGTRSFDEMPPHVHKTYMRAANAALAHTPPQCLAARDGEVLALREALNKAIDRLQFVDPCADETTPSLREALTNSDQAAKDAEDRIRAKALEDAYNALFVLPAASIEQEQMAQRCQAAIRAMKGGE